MTPEEAIEISVKKMKLKRYSQSTIKTYKSMLITFFKFYQSEVESFEKEEIHKYLLLLMDLGFSESMQNQAINAIKFFYEKVLDYPTTYYTAERPEKEKRLPTVLSPEEVRSILDQVKNIKHKSLLMVVYSSGLQISEALHLQLSDIDSHRMLVHGKVRREKKTEW